MKHGIIGAVECRGEDIECDFLHFFRVGIHRLHVTPL
jgi:hypothetical protein